MLCKVSFNLYCIFYTDVTSPALCFKSAEYELGPDKSCIIWLTLCNTWENKSCWETKSHISLNTKLLLTAAKQNCPESNLKQKCILISARKGLLRHILAFQGQTNKMSLGKIRFICFIFHIAWPPGWEFLGDPWTCSKEPGGKLGRTRVSSVLVELPRLTLAPWCLKSVSFPVQNGVCWPRGLLETLKCRCMPGGESQGTEADKRMVTHVPSWGVPVSWI